MRKELVGKILVLGIICLFIGVGVQPAFAVETIRSNENNTNDNELIEVTFRICKFNKIIENTVWLTQEESDELDYIIDNVKKDLENAKDKNEENEVRNNAIISFNELGLLPENMNCKIVKNLVSNDIYNKVGNKLKIGNNNNYKSDGFRNWFCSITGESDRTYVLPPLTIFLYKLSKIISDIIKCEPGYIDDNLFLWLIMMACILIGEGLIKYSEVNVTGNQICFGGGHHDGTNYPAEGWIHTNGLNGEKSYEGRWYGRLKKLISSRMGFLTTYYIGVTGFTGLQIWKDAPTFSFYYMGSALRVNIGTEPPLYEGIGG